MAITIDIQEFYLTHKRLTGQTLKLFFKKANSTQTDKVLELTNVAAFIDNHNDEKIVTIEIRDSAGTYGTDMAMQLKRPEVQKFKELFLFTDSQLINNSFRAIAEEIVWRDFENNYRDINY